MLATWDNLMKLDNVEDGGVSHMDKASIVFISCLLLSLMLCIQQSCYL